MEAYAISSANLDTIGNNLGAVAKELSGVIQNVNSVNSQVNNVEEKVSTLDTQIKGLVKEIRETMFLTSARQSIMYNNEQLEKKFGYFDNVRRMTISVIDSVLNSNIDKNFLVNQRQKVILNNPDYWLSNAYGALISWILDDRSSSQKDLENALRKNPIKTKLFFMLINLKFNRDNVALNWLESYLDDINPLKLDSSFIEVLELCVNEVLGLKGKEMVVKKINDWMTILFSDESITDEELDMWDSYIRSYESNNLQLPYIDKYSIDKLIMDDNLYITSSYESVLKNLTNIVNKKGKQYTIDEIIRNAVNDFESDEKIFQEDNLKNKLIIECNGDKAKAEELFEKQKSSAEDKTNIIFLFNNIVMHPKRFESSENVKKLALCYISKYIKKTYENINEDINKGDINILANDLSFTINNNTTMDEIKKHINDYVESLDKNEDKLLWVFLFIIDIIGIIGIFFVFSNKILFMALIMILAVGNIIFLYKILKLIDNNKQLKQRKRKELATICEVIYAENKEYEKSLSKGMENYQRLVNFLDALDINNYMASSRERNIDIR